MSRRLGLALLVIGGALFVIALVAGLAWFVNATASPGFRGGM